MAALVKAVPLVTEPMPLSTLPDPLLKVGVMVVVPPKGTGFVAATRLVATGAGGGGLEWLPPHADWRTSPSRASTPRRNAHGDSDCWRLLLGMTDSRARFGQVPGLDL